MDHNVSRIIEIMKDIINIPSPCGKTAEISKYCMDFVINLGYDVLFSQRDSFCIRVNGNKGRWTPFVCSHFDTLGAIVSSIKDNGRLGFAKLGFYHLSVIENENINLISSSNGKQFRGTCVYNKPTTHVFSHQDLDERRTLNNMEIRLDIEAKTKKELEELGISVGDYIIFDTRFEETDTGFLKSRYLDDKSSVAISLYLLEVLSQIDVQNKGLSYFYFSDMEEIGYGANITIPEDCDLFAALDMGPVGKDLETDETKVCICAKDSLVPYSLNANKYLTDICKKNKIEYAIAVYPNYGSDIMPVLNRGFGGQFCLFGPGVSASHSYERTHRQGLLNTCSLLYHLLTDTGNNG